MWLGGQVWKPGPAYPATAAAWPPRGGFVFGFSVAGVADPGRGAERLSERHFGTEPAVKKRIRSRVLRDVAWGPRVETWAGVPGYSGGLAACVVVS